MVDQPDTFICDEIVFGESNWEQTFDFVLDNPV